VYSNSFTFGAVPSAIQLAGFTTKLVECADIMFDEYEDLAGIGINLGDRMKNMNLTQQLEWVEAVVFPAIHAAKRGDEIKLIWRPSFGML